LLTTVVTAAAQPAGTQHARVELLSRQETVSGGNLQLGVHFILEPGWHIYWVNPGDSGQPPVFKWQLPAGFSAGEVQWPRPERMQPSPELADFGYHDEVLLPVTLHVPPSATIASPLEIGVEAKWLICREVCLPEHAKLHLSLPVGASAKKDPRSAPLFARNEKLLPQPMPRGWKARATSRKDEFVLALDTGRPIAKAEVFPLEPGEIDNPAPQKIQPSRTGCSITLKKSDLLLKPITVLRGVLVIPGGAAYRIEAPVHESLQ
jgi:DsbC/DsbD-like thiol-disulfide interchange protein